MDHWIEWIPNISTGDEELIKEISHQLKMIPDLYLLHTDIGKEVNRTVFTFAGTLTSLREALFTLVAWLEQNLDMSAHTGTHPRMGALDVCPYVPLTKDSREELTHWVKQTAGEISQEFNYPIYLYEGSASRPDRANLADIRKGEYERLRSKMQDIRWKPDFGTDFNIKLGATVMGVRDFLIAYNVNLDSDDIRLAKAIAGEIRSKGAVGRKYQLPDVKAIGWKLNDAGFCQVSTNITETRNTTPLDVYHTCQLIAEKWGIQVTGSELIGLIPYHSMAAMLDKDNFTTALLASHLGLAYCHVHDLRYRVIEHKAYIASGKSLFNELFDEE